MNRGPKGSGRRTGRIILIGDIHGCIEEFKELVSAVKRRPEDRVVCLGDFLDKGPSPVECVAFARSQRFESVLGNHEEKHLRWRRHEARRSREPGYRNPMRPLAPEERAANEALSGQDVAWLRSLKVVLELAPGFRAVHGGVLPGLPITAQDPQRLVRLRWVDAQGEYVPLEAGRTKPPGARPWMCAYDGDCNVVYGHAVHSLDAPRIDVTDNGAVCYGIDTGCVHGGRLTAMIIEPSDEVSFVQVQGRSVYVPRAVE